MIYGRIYLITNLITGRVYVGQTTRALHDRLKSHRNAGKKSRLGTSMRFHGPEHFKIEELATARCKEALDELERRFIRRFNSTDPARGYNFEIGGAGQPKPREAVERGASKLRGKPLSAEHRKKIAQSKSGKKQTREHVENMLAGKRAGKGFKHTEEARRKIAALALGRKMPPVSEETKRKLSEAAKADWAKRKAAKALANTETASAVFLCP